MIGRWALLGAGILFAIFAANIVIGKIAVLSGATTVPGLGDVGEFLVLFAAVALFIAACLEKHEKLPDIAQEFLVLFAAVALFIAACLARERAADRDTRDTND